MTIAMLALAGFPATAGFFGKLYLIDAAVDNGYAWLGVVIVLGSAISLAYYLRVVAAVWMRSPRGAEPPAALAPGPAMARPRRPTARRARRRGRVAAARAPRPWRGAAARLVQPEVMFVAVVCARRRSSSGSIPSRCSTSPRDAGAALANLL